MMDDKNIKILYIVPPYFNIDYYLGNLETTALPAFTIPYGILSIDAFIKGNVKDGGVKTDILDFNIEAFRIITEKRQNQNSDLLKVLKDKVHIFQPDIVAISALFNTSYNYLAPISTVIK